MITHDQLLPSIYQMQRQGRVGEISVCALNVKTIRALAGAEGLLRAFPGQSFRPFPSGGDPDAPHPDLFRECIASLPPRQVVVTAVPDQMHYDVIMTALRHDQHVLTVKPLVLKYSQALEIEQEAYRRGLVVGRRVSQALRRPQLPGAAEIPRGRLRRVPAGQCRPAREVVLPPL